MEAIELTWGDKILLARLDKARQESLEKGREEGLEKGLEEGLERGLEKGREGQRSMLRQVLRRRFGAIPEPLEARIAAAGESELAALLDQALAANGVDDLLAQ